MDWIQRRGTSPLDPDARLTADQVVPNLYLRGSIDAWLEQKLRARKRALRQLQ